jgi:hypothetical protein
MLPVDTARRVQPEAMTQCGLWTLKVPPVCRLPQTIHQWVDWLFANKRYPSLFVKVMELGSSYCVAVISAIMRESGDKDEYYGLDSVVMQTVLPP